MTAVNKPWISGPLEILCHGLSLLAKDSDSNRRLAMLSIDNAVELAIKTYLGLPKRVTSLNISRSKYDEMKESFPRLLDGLEEFASQRIIGVDLGEIEWYHRLRNELYHQGNGLTIDRDKVTVYAEIAKALFKVLFDIEVAGPSDDRSALVGEFILAWGELEQEAAQALIVVTTDKNVRPFRYFDTIRQLGGTEMLSRATLSTLDDLRILRNEVSHAQGTGLERLSKKDVQEVKNVTAQLRAIRSERSKDQS